MPNMLKVTVIPLSEIRRSRRWFKLTKSHQYRITEAENRERLQRGMTLAIEPMVNAELPNKGPE